MEPVFGAKLEQAEKGKLAARLQEQPHEYVAQEQNRLIECAGLGQWTPLFAQRRTGGPMCSTPAMDGQQIPGGLVRVAEAEGSVVSMQRGGTQQGRVGALGQPPSIPSACCTRAINPVALRRELPGVPEQVWPIVFLARRYVERAENTARIARNTDFSCAASRPGRVWGALLRLHRSLKSRQSKLPKAKKRRATALEFEHEFNFHHFRYQTNRQPGFYTFRSVTGLVTAFASGYRRI